MTKNETFTGDETNSSNLDELPENVKDYIEKQCAAIRLAFANHEGCEK